jgi:hypothetical protein
MDTRPWNWPPFVAALLGASLLFAQVASAETVIMRRRVGNNAEAMTYDPVNDRAVVMDGNDVIGVALNPLDAVVLATMRNDSGGIRGPGYRKLFDVLALPEEGHEPKGIGYVPSQHAYYFVTDEPGGTATIFVTDEEGHPRPSLPFKGLAAPVDFWEGIAWIPPGAPAHGGTLAILGARDADDDNSHVYFVRLDGTMEQELIPQPGSAVERYFCGIAYWPAHPSTLLLSDCTSGIFEMDLRTGAPVLDGEVLPNPETFDVEGLLVRRSGAIVLSGYEGRLFAYDGSLRRTAAEDRLFTLGLGVSARWLAWNIDRNEYLALTPGGIVYRISADLQVAEKLFDAKVTNELPNPVGITYLGNNEVGISNAGPPRGIDFAELLASDPGDFPNGTSHQRLIWNASDGFPPGKLFNPRGFGMLDANTVAFRAVGDPSNLKVVTRSGRPDASLYRDGVVPNRLPDLPLSSPTIGFTVQFFDNGSGRRIFTGADIYAMDGTLLHHIDNEALGMAVPVNNGIWIGGNTFAAVDGFTSTVVVYTVP